MANDLICSIIGCGKRVWARGWCSAHYCRWKRNGDPCGGRVSLGATRGEAKRYYREVVLSYDGDECLIWPYSRDRQGYGRVQMDGKLQYVARMACNHVNGPPPTPAHQAAHSCGKGHLACVAKRHVRWATPKENIADRYVHGTLNRPHRRHEHNASGRQ